MTEDARQVGGSDSAPQQVRIDLRSYRPAGAKTWKLPPWDHPLAQGVFPLFHRTAEDRLVPLGTAFCVSRLGLVASATHCVHELLKDEPRGIEMRAPGSHSLTASGLSILHHSVREGSRRGTLWQVENFSGGWPGDAVFGFLPPSSDIPLLSCSLSPGVPRIGAKVLTVGYCDFRYPDGGIPMEAIVRGAFDWERDYAHTLLVSEGTIETIFIHRYSTGYANGPCFLTDASTLHGQSGGPVFNEAGHVCGIHSTSLARLLGRDAALASLIYPHLAVGIKATLRFGPIFTINFINPLVVLLYNGAIRTDGSERLCVIDRTPDGMQVHPAIARDDRQRVFIDVHGLSINSPAPLLTEEDLDAIRRKTQG